MIFSFVVVVVGFFFFFMFCFHGCLPFSFFSLLLVLIFGVHENVRHQLTMLKVICVHAPSQSCICFVGGMSSLLQCVVGKLVGGK